MTDTDTEAPVFDFPRIRRRNYGRGHGYTVDGRKGFGVSTVAGTLPKQLSDWAADQVATKAVNEWEALAALPVAERYKELKGAARGALESAATRGTRIHTLAEGLARGEPVDVPDEDVGPVEAVARFLDRWDITPVASEAIVGHPGLGVAGTLDLLATVGKRDNALAVIDYKTGDKGPYDSDALQCVGYSRMELLRLPDAAEEIDMPRVDLVCIAKVLPDDVRLIQVTHEDQLWRTFQYLLAVRRWLAGVDWRDPYYFTELELDS